MKTKFNGILTLLLALMVQITFAQEKIVTGKVSDANGPLPGVTVIIKGTKTGTQTDFDGNYSIKAATGSVLQFSYIGYSTTEQTVGSSNVINLVMQENAEALEEVVIVAYGSQTKESIVGAVAVLDSEVIESQQVTSATSALQGSVAGVNVFVAGGQPGENATIRIRGVGSINASNDPLIVLDGAPFNGNLNTIAPDQIESMTVLKDASSTAIYGSRGTNGVILITTKQGRLNSPTRITFKSTLGMANQAVPNHKLINTDTYMPYAWEAIKNVNQYVNGQTPADAGQNASNSLISSLGYNPYGPGVPNPVDANGNLVTTDKLWETDWEDALINNAAFRVENSLSLSGGNEKTKYYFGMNYLDQDGSVKTSNFNRTSARINITSDVKKWLTLSFNTAYSTSSQNYPTQSGSSYQSAIQWIYTIPSVYPLYQRDENGVLNTDAFGNNIYDYGDRSQLINGIRPQLASENALGALYNYTIENKRDNYTANGTANFNITDYLSFRTNLAYEKYTFDNFEYSSNEYGNAASVGGRVSQDRNFTSSLNWLNQLTFNKKFGNDDHGVNADLIHESNSFKIDALGSQGIGFLPGVKVLNGSTSPESVSGYITEETLESYLARAGYNYKGKYFVEGSFRTDGSSRFSEDVRWGNFYSIGGSWVLSNEEWMRSVDMVDYLKLRSSYGEQGNKSTSSYFPYLQLFQTDWNQLENTGVILGGVTDPNLTWEKNSQFNIGVDFSLFKSRLTGVFDYYNKKSIDLIYDQPLAPSTGNSSITTNVGSIRNKGFELSLTGVVFDTPNFVWTSSFNVSHNKQEVLELTQDSFINGSKRWEVGKSTYEFYIREYAGVNPANGYAMWFKDVLDTDGNPTGESVTTEDYSEASRNYSDRSSLPDFYGGFTNNFKVGDFDLNILLNFSVGSYIYDSSYASLMAGFQREGSAAHVDLASRWQQPGDITDVPLFLQSNNDFTSQSSRFLFKNDYLRLKALTLGYNFPEEIIGESLNLRVFLQGDNLLTFQSHKGIDPEQSIAGTTNSRSYNQRIVSFGVKLDF